MLSGLPALQLALLLAAGVTLDRWSASAAWRRASKAS
jgi:hypothetical protein